MTNSVCMYLPPEIVIYSTFGNNNSGSTKVKLIALALYVEEILLLAKSS